HHAHIAHDERHIAHGHPRITSEHTHFAHDYPHIFLPTALVNELLRKPGYRVEELARRLPRAESPQVHSDPPLGGASCRRVQFHFRRCAPSPRSSPAVPINDLQANHHRTRQRCPQTRMVALRLVSPTAGKMARPSRSSTRKTSSAPSRPRAERQRSARSAKTER